MSSTQPVTNGQEARFSREQLAGYDPSVLARAAILVIGAGALAQNLLINLALSGVGELRIVDFDEFEDHNAPRSPLYPTVEEQALWGMAKARVVAHKIERLMRADAPRVSYALEPIQALGTGAFLNVGVVISCVDNPEARAYLSDTCRWLGLTLIEGGFDGPSITMACYSATDVDDAAEAPCYRCGNARLEGTFSCEQYAIAAESAGVIPGIQAAAATLGGLQAEAAVQALHGEHPLGFRRLSLNIRNGQFRQYELSTDPLCKDAHPRAHRRIADEPADLAVTADSSLGTIIDRITADLGAGAKLKLPDGLVHDAFCRECARPTLVTAPDWAWRATPLCAACGGRYERIPSPRDGYSPTIIQEVHADEDQSIRDLTCKQAGISPLSLFEAWDASAERLKIYRLAGQLPDLFESTPSPT